MPGCSDASVFIDLKAYLTICLSSNPYSRGGGCMDYWRDKLVEHCMYFHCSLLWHVDVSQSVYLSYNTQIQTASHFSLTFSCGAVEDKLTGQSNSQESILLNLPKNRMCCLN